MKRTYITTVPSIFRSFAIFPTHLLFHYPLPLKDVQATGEAFSPQKRTSSTSKDEIYLLFYIFVGHFCPLDPDPDRKSGYGYETPLNPIPSGSGSTTLLIKSFPVYTRMTRLVQSPGPGKMCYGATRRPLSVR
jgi:hypothetical protein